MWERIYKQSSKLQTLEEPEIWVTGLPRYICFYGQSNKNGTDFFLIEIKELDGMWARGLQ
jgi:hypothetical protein